MCDKFENVVRGTVLRKWSFLEPDAELFFFFFFKFRLSYSCENLFYVHMFVLKLPEYFLKVLAILKVNVVRLFSQCRPPATLGNVGDV